MKYKATNKRFNDYAAEDLAMEDSFIEWVNNPNGSQRKFWEEWCASNPQKSNEVEVAKMIVLTLGGEQRKISRQEVDNEWNRFISSRPQHKSTRFDRWGSSSYFKVAVVVMLPVLLWLAVFFASGDADSVQLIEKRTDPGQRLTTTLPDGSKVILNAQSSISYRSDFEEREVFLTGEAYFDVAHDPKRRFNVRLQDISAKVYGTSFNIRSYPDAPIQIALETGSVLVTDQKEDIDLFLKPGEIVTIDSTFQNYRIDKFNHLDVFGWRDGYICFNKTSFPEAIRILERWYGVEFDINEQVDLGSSWKFHGKFQNKSLVYVLHTLSYPDLFQYKITGKKINIY